MITDKGDYLEYYQPDPDCKLKEDAHQIDSYQWIKYHFPDLVCWHTVNEGKKTIVTANRDEQAGLVKGVSDLMFLNGIGCKYPFGAIELKRTNKSGKAKASPVSKEQKAFLARVRNRGGFAAVCYGFEQVKLAVEDMLK